MDTWDAIRSRRNVREFGAEPLSDDQLERILEAGRRSPSSQNWPPWDFVLVTDPGRLTELAKVWRGAQHVASSAATVALVAPVTEEGRQQNLLQYDLGQATMSMMIMAASLGIGSGHAAVTNQDLARTLLGFPSDRFCAYLIAMGYPARRPLAPIAHPDRRPYAEVVHHERW